MRIPAISNYYIVRNNNKNVTAPSFQKIKKDVKLSNKFSQLIPLSENGDVITIGKNFETVIDGLNKYIDREIYRNLNELQEFVARLVVGRVNQGSEAIKVSLMNNGFIRTMCIIDTDGMVDIDSVLQDVRREIERKGSLQFEIPFIGKLTFCPSDVEVLREYICGR